MKMSYRISAKNRKLKRILEQIFSIIKFEWLNISHPLKIVMIWVIIATFWLFGNWVDTYNSELTGNAFYKLLWITGYILLVINIKILFFVFGQQAKEFIKNIFNIKAKDSVLILMFLFFGFFTSLNAVFLVENTQMFREGILLWKWLIVTLVWYTLWCIGWCINLFEKTKTSIYIQGESSENSFGSESNTSTHENNMKLPF